MYNKSRIFKALLIGIFSFLFFNANAQKLSTKDKDLVQAHLEKGYEYITNGEDSLSLIEYQKALAIDSVNHNAFDNIILIHAKNGREQLAIQIANIAIGRCKEDLADFYRHKANCIASLEKFEEALPVYLKAYELEPENANLNYNYGYCYFELKQWENAIKYLKIYEEIDNRNEGNFNDAMFYLGTSYQHLNKFDEALEYFDKAIEAEPFYSYFYNKAEVLLDQNNFPEALKTVNAGLELFPDTAELYHKRYNVYKKMNQIENANLDLKKAYAMQPNNSDYLIDMGVFYKSENNIENAIECYKKCIENKENVAGAYCNLAGIYEKNDLTQKEAIEYYQRAIEAEPSNAKMYYNFGNYFSNKNEPNEAKKLFLKSIKLDPTLPEPYNNMAVLFHDLKNYDSALVYALKALELTPQDYSSNALTGDIYFYQKKYTKAIEYINIALKLEPYKNKVLLNNRGVSRQMLGDYKNAIYDYLDIVANYDDDEKHVNAGIYGNIGYCYLEMNELENAQKYFREAVNYNSEIDQLIGLFTVQYLLNDQANFESTLKQAKKVYKPLKNGFDGILQLEKEGYFYTNKHKEILKKILK